jgi:guanylate kinase
MSSDRNAPSPAGAAIARRGLGFVLSSPSGAGKTTLAHRLLQTDGGLELSVSATTRPRRPKEIEGRDYFFTTVEAFEEGIREGRFLEYARVFSNIYGTPRAPVEAWLELGRDVLFDVDWQGAQQLRQAMGEDVVSVFILPPSLQALEERLRKRAQDSEKVMADRMAKAADEISHWAEYDYVIVNEDLEASEAKLKAILTAERLRRGRQLGLTPFVRDMLAAHPAGNRAAGGQ